jgi:hypothetical protein
MGGKKEEDVVWPKINPAKIFFASESATNAPTVFRLTPSVRSPTVCPSDSSVFAIRRVKGLFAPRQMLIGEPNESDNKVVDSLSRPPRIVDLRIDSSCEMFDAHNIV